MGAEDNGGIMWTFQTGEEVLSSPIAFGDQVFSVTKSNLLFALGFDNGQELWRVPWEFEMNASTPAVSNNVVFITSFTMGGQAIEITKDSYNVLWKNDAISAHHSDPVIVEGFLYGYSGFSGRNKGDFKCVELKTGTSVTGFETSGQQISSVITTEGTFTANQVVLAAGAWSPLITKNLKLRLPIQPAKSGNLTFT